MTDNPSLVVKYWGVRGSIPCPLSSEQVKAKQVALIQKIIADGGCEKLLGASPSPEKIQEYLRTLPLSLSGTYGGDTTCFEIQARNSPLIILDAGTGIRMLGRALLGRLFADQHLNPLSHDLATQQELHLFFTHYHWDHIQGFPFFAPAFVPGKKKITIRFYGKRDARVELSEVLKGQQQFPNFPVIWEDMPAQKRYLELRRLNPRKLKLGNVEISYQELTHPDFVFAYRFEVDGKSFVCATDTEHKDMPDPRLLKIAQDADILYYDSHYTPEEYRGTAGCLTGVTNKFDWGHSTYEWAVKNALAANVKTVVLGHHEPLRDDFNLEQVLERSMAYCEKQLKLPQNAGKKLEIVLAHQGLEQKLYGTAPESSPQENR